jgi:hypothetical protein
MPMTTITEDFLLLVLDGATGKPRIDSSSLSLGLAGGVLLDLSLAGRVVVPERGAPDAGRVVLVPGPPLGHPVLDSALAIIARDKPQKPETVVSRLSKNLREAVFASLESRGLVRRHERKVLGIFPSTAWPVTSPLAGDTVRQSLWSTLVLKQDPDAPTAARQTRCTRLSPGRTGARSSSARSRSPRAAGPQRASGRRSAPCRPRSWRR